MSSNTGNTFEVIPKKKGGKYFPLPATTATANDSEENSGDSTSKASTSSAATTKDGEKDGENPENSNQSEDLSDHEEGEGDTTTPSKRQRRENSLAAAVVDKINREVKVQQKVGPTTVTALPADNVVMTILNLESLRKMESNFSTASANGIALTLRQLIDTSLHVAIGAQLVTAGMEIDPWCENEWLDTLAVVDFVSAMRPLVSESITG